MKWHPVEELLPQDGQRILAFVPNNKVFLPGKSGEFELREIIMMKFCKDFYPEGSERRTTHGAHFWQGEGNSNHFFKDVTHWQELPPLPE